MKWKTGKKKKKDIINLKEIFEQQEMEQKENMEEEVLK